MTKSELIKRLNEIPDNPDIMILDGFNGGGVPRTLNLGPAEHKISFGNGDETVDCENRVGETVIVIGFGCY